MVAEVAVQAVQAPWFRLGTAKAAGKVQRNPSNPGRPVKNVRHVRHMPPATTSVPASVPAEVGGRVMAFVPGPERFAARLACRAMALWPTDSVANVWLAPNEADRLRHPRHVRPRADVAMPIDADGWWRGRVAVVRILSVLPFRSASRKRLRDGSTVALELFGSTREGTVLPAPDAEDDGGCDVAAGGWAWLERLFPAVRAVELVATGMARVCGHWLESPPRSAPSASASASDVVLVRGTRHVWGAALYDGDDMSPGMPPTLNRIVHVDAADFADYAGHRTDDRDPNSTANSTAAGLKAALGTLCRDVYPRDGNWLALHALGVRSFAEVADAVAASGFVLSDAPDTNGPDTESADRVHVTVWYLSARAASIRLAPRTSERVVLRSGGLPEVVADRPPDDEAGPGTSMAATRIDIQDMTHGTIAALRGLRWPRLREVRVHAPARADDQADATARLCAALEWALALPRLFHLAVICTHGEFCSATVAALLSGVGGRTARGMPPLRLDIECFGSAGRAARLVAHPAVAVVGLRVVLAPVSQATKRETQRLCAELARPAGPAVLRRLWVQTAQPKSILPDALLRPLVRAQPLLRELKVGW